MNKGIFTATEKINGNNAGPKAKTDIDYFMKDRGFDIIHRSFNVHSKLAKLKDAIWTIPHLLNSEDQFDELFFQYPMYSSYLMPKLLNQLKSKTNKLYLIIHDVESLRLFQGDESYWQSERALFNYSDGMIVHNHQMKEWLANHGVTVPMVELGIFDYENPQPVHQKLGYRRSVCFAGNLAKSTFLNSIALNKAHLDIFGASPNQNYLSGVTYQGQYTPEELPKHLNQNFGLVWDGSSVKNCNGQFGEYMKYNDPHKVSLYLSSGLPVIIWRYAALAQFVDAHQVGILVDDLSNLDDILCNLSEEQYLRYKRNVLKLSAKLRSGYFIKTAVDKIEHLN